MDERNLYFIGIDLYEFVNAMCRLLIFKPESMENMTENEQKCYELGVNNVLGILKQSLEQLPDSENEECKHYLVHAPGLYTVEEFASIEKVDDKCNQIYKEKKVINNDKS